MSIVYGPNVGLMAGAADGDLYGDAMRAFQRGVDSFLMPNAKGYLTNTPPGSPADGDLYIIGAAPTGAWAGQGGKVTRWSSVANAWEFYAPKNGWMIQANSARDTYRYTGGAWEIFKISAGMLEGDAIQSTTSDFSVTSTTASTSTTTGALVVGGGVGIGGSLFGNGAAFTTIAASVRVTTPILRAGTGSNDTLAIGNGTELRTGKSGTGYPFLGYNANATSTSNVYTYNATDNAWMIDFGNGRGLRFLGATSGTAGTNIPFSELITCSLTSVTIPITTVSTSPSTGALVVSGGVASGDFFTGKYRSSDGSAGLTATRTFYAASSSGGATNVLNTVTIKDGIITSWTQA